MLSYLLLPIIAFVISFVTSQAGISGAFLLLPVQISFLNIVSPVASSTNLLYNVISTPSGVYGYWREKRLCLKLAASILSGTIPGMLTGVYLRVKYLPSPEKFKVFAGFVLLYMSFRLLYKTERKSKKKVKSNLSLKFKFGKEYYSVEIYKLVPVAYIIGVVAGAYGVGGGAFLSPLLISIFQFPVYYVSGAVLLSTFVTSIISCFYYSSFGYYPNLIVGLMFGLGGILGMYTGAKLQIRFPEKFIRTSLALIVLFIAIKYILSPFFHPFS